jgi:hypothetical protein
MTHDGVGKQSQQAALPPWDALQCSVLSVLRQVQAQLLAGSNWLRAALYIQGAS